MIDTDFRSHVDDWAWLVALEQSESRCQCSRREQGCLHRNEHHLPEWDSLDTKLGHFLSQAVKGSNRRTSQGHLLAGLWDRGMLSRKTEADVGLIADEVERWQCRTCQQLWRQPDCEIDDRPLAASTDKRVWTKRLFIKPDFPGHDHRQVTRTLCATDRSLFDGPACPLCGTPAKRKKTVWTPISGPLVVDLDVGLLAESGDDAGSDDD